MICSVVFRKLSELFLGKHDIGVCGVSDNAFDAVFAARLCGVAFACRYRLAVSCLETEAELALFVEVDLELRVNLLFVALDGLILDVCGSSTLSHALDAVLAARKGVEHLSAGADDLTVASLEAEGVAGVCFLDDEFSHDTHSFLAAAFSAVTILSIIII